MRFGAETPSKNPRGRIQTLQEFKNLSSASFSFMIMRSIQVHHKHVTRLNGQTLTSRLVQLVKNPALPVFSNQGHNTPFRSSSETIGHPSLFPNRLSKLSLFLRIPVRFLNTNHISPKSMEMLTQIPQIVSAIDVYLNKFQCTTAFPPDPRARMRFHAFSTQILVQVLD